MAQWDRCHLCSTSMQVQSPPGTVVKGSSFHSCSTGCSYSSDLILGLGIPHARRWPNKKERGKKKKPTLLLVLLNSSASCYWFTSFCPGWELEVILLNLSLGPDDEGPQTLGCFRDLSLIGSLIPQSRTFCFVLLMANSKMRSDLFS